MARRKKIERKVSGIELEKGQWFPMGHDDVYHIDPDKPYTRFEALAYLRMALNRHGAFKPATYYKKIFNWPCSKRVTRIMREIDASKTPNKRRYEARKTSYKSRKYHSPEETMRQLNAIADAMNTRTKENKNTKDW